MRRSVLIAYATRHGSTQEVAEEIAGVMRSLGNHVDVAAAELVTSLANYNAVVVGGALYTGRWHKDAVRFLKQHERALRHVPFAVYAMGPRTLSEQDVSSSRRQLDAALARTSLTPFAIAIFGGVVKPAELRFPFSRMPATDARDHAAIRAWAQQLSLETAA
jgi:menaquinone-dependent protoporphyrinogen oxidase